MHRKFKWPAVVFCLLFFASSAAAQISLSGPSPPPSPQPTPFQTPDPQTCISCNIAAPPAPPTAEETIPVVITYGDGTETRAQITRGLMEPVGIPPNLPVTVTLYLASGIAGSPVQVGLFDGGRITPALAQSASLPNPSPVETSVGGNGITVDPTPATPILVLADGTVRFNFQSDLALGLYRTVVIIGPKQYLLQFYAVRPRANSSPQPLPTAEPRPTVRPPPTPAPPPV